MTVREAFENKYREWLKRIRKNEWLTVQEMAEHQKLHPADYMILCLEITEKDIKANGGYKSQFYAELKQMHEAKLIASNCHRQEHGHIDRYWLTKKGLKKWWGEQGK